MPTGWKRTSTGSIGPRASRLLQRNWIGRSTGAEVDFFIGSGRGCRTACRRSGEYEGWRRDRELAGYPSKPDEQVLRIYTTRPDTLFGATYMVIAPEHPLVQRLTAPEQAAAVRAYCEQAARKSDLDRTDLAKDKTGVFTGSYAINPVNGKAIPIWVADYVLISYGTGAIMAVPAHDTRDFEFAQEFELPIIPVVDPGREAGAIRDRSLVAGRGGLYRRRHGRQFRPLQRPADRRVQAADRRRPGRPRAWAARR